MMDLKLHSLHASILLFLSYEPLYYHIYYYYYYFFFYFLGGKYLKIYVSFS